MSWEIQFIPEALEDFRKLDGSNKLLVRKALRKVSSNPLSVHDGGYGHPLGNMTGSRLAGYYKIKLRAAGIRIVYKLIMKDDQMLIIIIGARADNEVYELADRRIRKNNL